jgi:hypothetical protein
MINLMRIADPTKMIVGFSSIKINRLSPTDKTGKHRGTMRGISARVPRARKHPCAYMCIVITIIIYKYLCNCNNNNNISPTKKPTTTRQTADNSLSGMSVIAFYQDLQEEWNHGKETKNHSEIKHRFE